MNLYAIKLRNGTLYRPKKHGPKVYTRLQDAYNVKKQLNLRGTVVTYSPTWI